MRRCDAARMSTWTGTARVWTVPPVFGPVLVVALALSAAANLVVADATIPVDITGHHSRDLVDDASNEVLIIDVAALQGLPSGTPILMIGIGWHGTIESLGTSWRSEARIYFDDNFVPDNNGLFLRPGFGLDSPGLITVDSGGVISLEDLGIADIPLPDGRLRLELHESYDDVADAIDSNWVADAGGLPSTLYIRVPGDPRPCVGDINGDDEVDLADLALLLADLDCAGGACSGDVDGDGDTDLTDLSVLLANFGAVCT